MSTIASRFSRVGISAALAPVILASLLAALLCLTRVARAAEPPAASPALPDHAQLEKMLQRFVPVNLDVDTGKLSKGDRQALVKLIEATRLMDPIYQQQLWIGGAEELARLKQDDSPLGRMRLKYFEFNQGPWSDLDAHQAFVPGVPARKPPGANFYPSDMTREEFESWAALLPKPEQDSARGFFTVLRRDTENKLRQVRYSVEYRPYLVEAAALLHEASALTPNASLKKFLELRAEAFLSDDYYASDVAWMDVDAPIELTIGPYETYTDEIFGYKAAFEAFLTLRDDAETKKLAGFSSRLQEIEDHLPIDPQYRNPKIGALAPIRVVNQVLASGDAAHGVRTAAFNLPNDERVVKEKGSKRVMLRNIQEAKFRAILKPLSREVLPSRDRKDLHFDSFFTHILAHELSHGIGPQQIRVGGVETSPRQQLKELFGAMEEAKADITGLFMLQYLMDHGGVTGLGRGKSAERKLYTTFLASAFRTLRFGAEEAHGRGMALQLNYLLEQQGFRLRSDGTYEVNPAKIRQAVTSLTHDLLTVEAKGDYEGAKALLGRYGVITPMLRKTLDHLEHLPVDIAPRSLTAEQVAPVKP